MTDWHNTSEGQSTRSTTGAADQSMMSAKRSTASAVTPSQVDNDAPAWQSRGMPEAWSGPPRPDESGHIPVEGFNRFLSRHPDLARSPVRATIEFVRLKDPSALTTTVRAEASRLENPQEVRVTLTQDGLPDDSIRAVRYVLEFKRAGQRWELESARRTQRCQPGRGHQRFSPKPCL